MKIITYKNNINTESGKKTNFILGLSLLIAGIANINKVSEKLNINKDALEEAIQDQSVVKGVSKINEAEWFNMDPESLNWGPFRELSLENRKRLQAEWREYANNPEMIEGADEEVEEVEDSEESETNSLNQNILARTLFHEARGDGESGMRDVASVIYNRATRRNTSMISEVFRRRQFCVWTNVSQEDRGKIIDESQRYTAPADRRAWDIANKIAEEMTNGSFVPVIDADHFHTPDVSPDWSKGMRGDRRGSHLFFRLL